MQRNHSIIFLVALVFLALSMTGCPRFAYLEIYNNTGVSLRVHSSGYEEIIAAGESLPMRITGKSFEAESALGAWRYPRVIPHDGEIGPFFDGTLRVQVNSDGAVFALPVGGVPPLAEFTEQPAGYPLDPAVD